jgi:hypothetical protein
MFHIFSVMFETNVHIFFSKIAILDYVHLSQTYYYKYVENELSEKCDGVIGTSPSKKGKLTTGKKLSFSMAT